MGFFSCTHHPSSNNSVMQRLPCHSISLHTGKQDWYEPIHWENIWSQHTGCVLTLSEARLQPIDLKGKHPSSHISSIDALQTERHLYSLHFPCAFSPDIFFPCLKQRMWKRLPSLSHVHKPNSEMLFFQSQASFPDPIFNCPECKCLYMKLLFLKH